MVKNHKSKRAVLKKSIKSIGFITTFKVLKSINPIQDYLYFKFELKNYLSYCITE